MAAAALTASLPHGPGEEAEAGRNGAPPEDVSAGHAPAGKAGAGRVHAEGEVVVAAPVRIADAAAVRLLRPGDHVDVIAGAEGDRAARVVARKARVDRLPESGETVTGDGALVVLAVPRRTATELVGAAATSRLAVTLC